MKGAKQGKERKSDVAYEKLRLAIIRAEILPGATIEEAELMRRLKVGRTPMREALLRLAHEDLILSVPQRGYFVTSTSASDFFRLSEFRTTCEVLACRLAASRITDSELLEFATLLEDAKLGLRKGKTDHKWHLGIDEKVHQLTAKAAGNPYLTTTLARLYALSVRSLYVARIPITLIGDEMENYELLYEALKARDPEAAAAAMSRHLDWNLVQVLRPSPSSEAAPAEARVK